MEVHKNYEYETKSMMERPITAISRLIGQNWYGTLEALAVKANVAKKYVTIAIRGGKIPLKIENKIREALKQ